MTKLSKKTALALSLALPLFVQAQGRPSAIDRPTALMETIQRGDFAQLPAVTQAAIITAQESAKVSASMTNAPQSVIDFSINQATNMIQQAREAYVAALPPRDQARGSRILLGDQTVPGSPGKFYYFVSRSMPVALLRAYAADALYTGGTLVVKGIRKGDTVKEYLQEVISEFNSADGQMLASMEINPNLYDMFDVKVVPTTVWTNRSGLDDIGSGCENMPEGSTAPTITLAGPDDTEITVDRPVCAVAPASSFFKIAGALNANYVLDRFQEAGAPTLAMDATRARLAERHSNVNSGAKTQDIGNGMTPIADDLRLDVMPRAVLTSWQTDLARKNVNRGPYGPVFTTEFDDDPVYRDELQQKINHGLGL